MQDFILCCLDIFLHVNDIFQALVDIMGSCIFLQNKKFSFRYNAIKILFIGGDKIKCFWFGKIKLGKAKLSNSNNNYNQNMQYSIIKSVIKTSYIK